MKKLYYVIEKDLFNIDGFQETTGIKYVRVYTIENGELEIWFTLELIDSDNTIDSIQNYLNDNGYNDETIKMIQL